MLLTHWSGYSYVWKHLYFLSLQQHSRAEVHFHPRFGAFVAGVCSLVWSDPSSLWLLSNPNALSAPRWQVEEVPCEDVDEAPTSATANQLRSVLPFLLEGVLGQANFESEGDQKTSRDTRDTRDQSSKGIS